ncbi:MAG: TolC family protein [Proteobacteria bacterium]|nr:TolC family protein [Pseudomonadota bacterium]
MRRLLLCTSAALITLTAPGAAQEGYRLRATRDPVTDALVLRPVSDPVSLRDFPISEALPLRGAAEAVVSSAPLLRGARTPETMPLSQPSPADTGLPGIASLRDAMDASLGQSYGLRAALAESEAAKARVYKAMAAYGPTINGNFDTRRERTLTTIGAGKDAESARVASLSVNMPLYTSGARSNALNRARSEAYASYAEADAKRDDVQLQSMDALVRFHQTTRFIGILTQNVRGLERLLGAVGARQSGGLASAADAADVRAELAANRIELQRNIEARDQARFDVEKMTGRTVGGLPRIESFDARLASGREAILAAANGNNPRLQAARHRADAAEYQVAETRARYLPRVDLYGRYDYYLNERNHGTRKPERFDFGVRLSVPLFDAALAGDVRESRERSAAMRYRAMDLNRDVSTQIRSDWTAWSGGAQRLKLARERVAALRRVVQAREARFAAGTAPIDDVLNERRRLASAEVTLVQIEGERAQLAAKVLANAGMLGTGLQ